MADQPKSVVYPPDSSGRRRVRADGEILGMAAGPADVVEFARRTGLEEHLFAKDDPKIIEWRGGGPDDWEPLSWMTAPPQRRRPHGVPSMDRRRGFVRGHQGIGWRCASGSTASGNTASTIYPPTGLG